MRHHRKLTDDERRQIIEARAGGMPASTLARRFGVSPRTIYNTLSKAEGGHPRTKTVSARVSERELVGFMTALTARGITDRPSALRRLMEAADTILTPADPAMIDKLRCWGVEIQTHGAAINQIARKLNEAKLRGCPMPYSAEDAAKVREMAMLLFDFMEQFQTLWGARRAAMTREVDKALAGLAKPRASTTSDPL